MIYLGRQGLFALGKCVDALNQNKDFVPYQDSKLTTLLSEALGGDSKTTIVVTAGAEDAHALETLQAIRFGERCMAVTNTADVGLSGMTAALQALDQEIEECEVYIQENERWETRVEQVEDERAGLHVDAGESLVKGKDLLSELVDREGVGIQNVVKAISCWIETVEALVEVESTEDMQLEQRQAVAGVREAAVWLKDHGSGELGQRVEDLVTVRVEASADQRFQTKTTTVATHNPPTLNLTCECGMAGARWRRGTACSSRRAVETP